MTLPEKSSPPCSVFGSCGGCQYQHLDYADELALKDRGLKDVLCVELPLDQSLFRSIVPSPKIYHYRNRLDLKLIHRRNRDVHVGFSPVDRGPVIEITACPIAMEAISSFIPQLRQEAAAAIPKEYRMANLTVRCGQGSEVRWGGIGRKSLRLEARDYFYVDIIGRRVYYSLDTFFQANLSILPPLIDFLRRQDIWSQGAVFFDLYGGVGFFGMCVNDLVAKVVNIEENVHAVRLAKYNISANSLTNVEAVEGRIEDILPARLAGAMTGKNIVMVDPPRAGLSQDAILLLNRLERVRHLVYLSCDPKNLAVNLKDLVAGGWEIMLIQPFDFFPRTRHVETLVILKRS
jgi:tRNA/tmRNA/rRNA uracil-C5-methylase (TrmA/RlmC/RlmD family)